MSHVNESETLRTDNTNSEEILASHLKGNASCPAISPFLDILAQSHRNVWCRQSGTRVEVDGPQKVDQGECQSNATHGENTTEVDVVSPSRALERVILHCTS